MDGGAVERLIAESRAEACAAGRKLALVYEVACGAQVAEFAAVEVACALTLSRFAAENLVQLATALCERLPAVLEALSNGDISLYKAQVFADVLADLDVTTARSVAALVLPKAPPRTASQVRDMLRRKAIVADPAYTAARRERAASRRCVQLHASNDGTASLSAFGLDPTRATAAMQRISAIARSRQASGVSGKLEQLRADVLLELLEGKHEKAARGAINLTVSLETLARWNNEPGILGGYGPIAADISRQWAESHPDYRWTYSIHDSATGALLQQGLTRAARPVAPNSADAREGDADAQGGTAGLARPPVQDPRDRAANAAMTRWIRLRDKTCRAPGCRMPAVQCDLDHQTPYSQGGLTAHDNLCALCRFHHRAKGEGGWVLVQSRPGHFIWISPMCRVYEVGPEPP